MAAGIANKAGQRELIEPDEPHAEQTIRRLSKRSMPVTSPVARLCLVLIILQSSAMAAHRA